MAPMSSNCAASEALLYEEAHGELSSVTSVTMPVLLLTSQALVALSGGGTQLAASIPLAGYCPSPMTTLASMSDPGLLMPQRKPMKLSQALRSLVALLPLQVPD